MGAHIFLLEGLGIQERSGLGGLVVSQQWTRGSQRIRMQSSRFEARSCLVASEKGLSWRNYTASFCSLVSEHGRFSFFELMKMPVEFKRLV